MLCFLHLVTGCKKLKLKGPIIAPKLFSPNFTVSFNFSHGNDGGGTYTCFLRDTDSCPHIKESMSCQGLTVTFDNARPNVAYTCGVNCMLGSVSRTTV